MYSKDEMKEHIQKSINHWNKDIINKFKEGWTLQNNCEWQNGQFILDTSGHCPLCKNYSEYIELEDDDEKGPCDKCPYRLYYEAPCDEGGSHWCNWIIDQSIETATAMRDSLVELLDNIDDIYEKYLVEVKK